MADAVGAALGKTSCSAVGLATAMLMSYLARSLSFTLFADLMRVKRLYYQHKKQQTGR